MARKSRYTSPLRDTSDVRPQCIAAIYLRLSVEDGDSLVNAQRGEVGWKEQLVMFCGYQDGDG